MAAKKGSATQQNRYQAEFIQGIDSLPPVQHFPPFRPLNAPPLLAGGPRCRRRQSPLPPFCTVGGVGASRFAPPHTNTRYLVDDVTDETPAVPPGAARICQSIQSLTVDTRAVTSTVLGRPQPSP